MEALLRDFAAKVTLTQRYRNAESQPIEAVYVFPVDEAAAVTGFEALVDGRWVVAEVEEREAAFEKYDDALAAGHGAYLLDQEAPDAFTASLGNVPPGAEVVVRIATVAELPLEGDAIRFTLPTSVSPRYAPEPDRTGVSPTRADRLNPPREWEVPYGLSLGVRLEMARSIPAPVQRPLDRLAALQRADGSWELTQALASALGVRFGQLEAVAAAKNWKTADARRAWATSLALAWLEAHTAADRDEWALLADKARDWLRAHAGAAGREALLLQACEVVRPSP